MRAADWIAAPFASARYIGNQPGLQTLFAGLDSDGDDAAVFSVRVTLSAWRALAARKITSTMGSFLTFSALAANGCFKVSNYERPCQQSDDGRFV